MKILVKVIRGDETSVEVDREASVSEVKKLLSQKLKIPIETQSLVYKGTFLSDSQKMSDLAIKEGDRLFLTTNEAMITKEEADKGLEEYDDLSGFFASLQTTLEKDFTAEDANRICQYIRMEVKRCVDTVNLDQLEQISKMSLEIHDSSKYVYRDEYYSSYEQKSEGATSS